MDLPIDRRRLFPREAAASLPLQVRAYNRMQGFRLSDESLRNMVNVGALPKKDDPDAVNSVYAQGW